MKVLEECNSFKMQRMMVRTDQLFCIAEVNGCKIYTRESEAKTNDRVNTLVLLLKQYNAHYYQFYETGTTRAMVGLQGMHMNNACGCCNMSTSVGLESLSLWCFKLGGNTETIATYLREVNHWLTIVCNICKAFASMSAQIILEHYSDVRSSCTKRSSR